MSFTCCVCGDKITKNETPIHMWEHQEAGDLLNFPDLNGTFTKPTEREMELHKKRLYGRSGRANNKCIVCNVGFSSCRDMFAHMYRYLNTPESAHFSEELKQEIEKSYCLRSISKSKSRLIRDIPLVKTKNIEKIKKRCSTKILSLKKRLEEINPILLDEIIIDDEIELQQELTEDEIYIIEEDHINKIPIPTLPVPELLYLPFENKSYIPVPMLLGPFPLALGHI